MFFFFLIIRVILETLRTRWLLLHGPTALRGCAAVYKLHIYLYRCRYKGKTFMRYRRKGGVMGTGRTIHEGVERDELVSERANGRKGEEQRTARGERVKGAVVMGEKGVAKRVAERADGKPSCARGGGQGVLVMVLVVVRVPFEMTPLRWIIQIGLSTDFRYMTCRRVRDTHGVYVVPSRRPAALHSPRVPVSMVVLVPVPVLLLPLLLELLLPLPRLLLLRRSPPVLLNRLLAGDQPNGIVGWIT